MAHSRFGLPAVCEGRLLTREEINLRAALDYAKEMIRAVYDGEGYDQDPVLLEIDRLARGERKCSDCGIKESKRWFGLRAGTPLCLSCYGKFTHQLRKTKKSKAKIYSW